MKFLPAFLLCLIATPAVGQSASPPCAPRDVVLNHLASKYHEYPSAVGFPGEGGNGVLQVLRSEKGETWSIIVVTPNGSACIIAAGEDWQELKYAVPAGDPL